MEAAILGVIRRLQDGFEPKAAASARLRQAVKRFEAAADAEERPRNAVNPFSGQQ